MDPTVLDKVNTYWGSVADYLTPQIPPLDDVEVILRLGLQVFLLAGSAFFSGAETALFSLSRLDLEKLRRTRNRHLSTIHALIEQPRRLIISILCGDELVNIAASANMAAILVILYGDQKAGWINLVVMVPLLLLFGEVTPKTVSATHPVRMSTSVVAFPMSVWVKLITPLRWIIRLIADRLTTLIVGKTKTPDNILQVDEFRTVIDEAARAGGLSTTERALVYNLLEAGAVPVLEIMTPRTKVKFVDASTPFPEIVAQCRQYRHERVPVYQYSPDNVIGVIHAEDILRLITNRVELDDVKLDDIMRSPVVVPWTKKIDEMLDFFKTRNAQAAVVLDEFGGVEGLITIRDVLSYIFSRTAGEVSRPDILKVPDIEAYELPGDLKLNEFNRLTSFGISDSRVTTIGGLMFCILDRLPQVGDRVMLDDVELVVQEMVGHRISRIRAARHPFTDSNMNNLQAVPQSDEFAPEHVEPQGTADNDASVTQNNHHENEIESASSQHDASEKTNTGPQPPPRKD